MCQESLYQDLNFILESPKHKKGPTKCRNDIMRTEGHGVENPVFNPRQKQIILPFQYFKRDDQ
jgi:hypothetical protein